MAQQWMYRPHGPSCPASVGPSAPNSAHAAPGALPQAPEAAADAYTPPVGLTQQLFQAFQNSPITLARRSPHAGEPATPRAKTGREI